MKTPKIVNIYLKHDDRVSMSLMDDLGDVIEEMDSDYLPYVNDIIGGDETSLEIDNETGQIIGWTPIQSLKKED